MKVKTLSIILIIILGFSLAVTACGKKQEETDPVKIATSVAKEWTAKNMDSISQQIADAAITDNALLAKVAAALIKQQIKNHTEWTYSTPAKISDNVYKVIPHAVSNFSITLVGSFTIAVDFQLTIDTAQKQVTNSSIDIGSLSVTKK